MNVTRTSLFVQVFSTYTALPGRVTAAAVRFGAVRSIVYTWPVSLPLPTGFVPPSLFPAPSTIESSSTRLSPSVPLPVPVQAVTVQLLPPPETLWIAGEPPRPLFTSAKSPVFTPATLSLKTTSHVRLAVVFVGEVPLRLMEVTTGGVVSLSLDTSRRMSRCFRQSGYERRWLRSS